MKPISEIGLRPADEVARDDVVPVPVEVVPSPVVMRRRRMSARWFNWRWRPANIWGRYRLRYLPTMTPEGRAGQEDAALRRGGGATPAPPGCSCEPQGQALHQRDCPYAKDRTGSVSGPEVPHTRADPFLLLTNHLREACRKAGGGLDAYDPDFLLGTIILWLQDNNAVLTGRGVASSDHVYEESGGGDCAVCGHLPGDEGHG